MTNHISLEREYQKISSTGILSEISFNTTHPEFERLYNNSNFYLYYLLAWKVL